MRSFFRWWVLLVAALGLVLLLAWLITSVPKHPVALIRVVAAAGKPVSGAVIRADGLRPKPGPYSHGHYGWRPRPDFPPNDPVISDAHGYGSVPYPKYVFERIETGEISFSVSHPDFVADRPFRTVTTRPPAGAPWRVWADYLWARIQLKALVARPDPVVLQEGAILRLSVRRDTEPLMDTLVFAQVSGVWDRETNFWIRPEPGVIATRRLAAGSQAVRAIQFDKQGSAWFSEVTRISATAGQTQAVVLDLQRGVSVRGQLDATVPRPVTNGRVVAHVWPTGHEPKNAPPEWHAWAAVRADGTFEIPSLPPGDLEIVALCDGFVSTNGPGQFQLRYPQKLRLGTNDLTITIGMEPTARLEVQVTDDKGNPLPDALVSTWPNVRYGEWSATILAGDCYNTQDAFLAAPAGGIAGWRQPVPDFSGRSDRSGLTVLPNLPVDVGAFSVEHPRFALPAVSTGMGDQRREARVTLVPGQTNRVSVRLEPREQSPIKHY